MSTSHDPALAEMLSAMLSAMPFAPALGVEVVSAAHGTVTLEAPLTPAFEAPPGQFAASSVRALGDMAAMMSVTSALPAGNAMSTMDFTVKMLGTARGTRLRAVGHCRQTGKTTCVGSADIYIQVEGEWTPCGTLLATGRRMSLG
ncbi:PaaI family thioesterase [uncultured Sulfitobacter sp.]|uniref:PaaI family thioesterase n=1 Tax=uncultured Sulfitobacter sp. TaxID=191468 RepID=UPI002624D2F8|nr:PaaI family thioesterase [uncultured Sulfitobacter sp.]